MDRLETKNDWRDCDHKFELYFGPTMCCKYCGATTIASVDGKSKPIYPPVDLDRLDNERM